MTNYAAHTDEADTPSARARSEAAAAAGRAANLLYTLASAGRPLATSEIISDSDLGYGSGNKASDQRKFRRDRESLAQVGCIVKELRPREAAADEESLWEIDQERTGITLPDTALDELLAALRAVEIHLTRPNVPYRQELLQVRAKLEQIAISRFDTDPHALRTAADATVGATTAAEKRELLIRDALWSAFSWRRTAAFAYRKPDGSRRLRHVKIYGFFTEDGVSYLSGADADCEGEPVKTFRLDRIDRVAAPGKTYTVPPSFSIDDQRFFIFDFNREDNRAHRETIEIFLPDTLTESEVRTFTHETGRLNSIEGGQIWSVPVRDTRKAAAYCLAHARFGVRPHNPSDFVNTWRTMIRKAVSNHAAVK